MQHPHINLQLCVAVERFLQYIVRARALSRTKIGKETLPPSSSRHSSFSGGGGWSATREE